MRNLYLDLSLWMALACSNLFGQKGNVDKAIREQQFHLSKVGYVMLGVTDIEAAAQFYGDKLGLKETRQTDDVIFFDAGTISLVISTAIGKEPGATEVVFSVEHVEQAYKALNQAGIKFERAPHPITESSWAANFRDPDGHILSLYGPK